MSDDQSTDLTQLLRDVGDGDKAAMARLVDVAYRELRGIASAHLRREYRQEHTLQPTALVHEAYMKLAEKTGARWDDRVHFFAAASQVMRHILIDHARSRSREKRGGGHHMLQLDESIDISDERSAELIALDDALKVLEQVDPQRAQIVELRYFGGLSNDEIAAVLNIGTATVTRSWRTAKAWLQTQLAP